jgi:hypothetical protein
MPKNQLETLLCARDHCGKISTGSVKRTQVIVNKNKCERIPKPERQSKLDHP